MPRHDLVLQVFVASPSDVAEERAILDSVVAELNRTWSSSLGLTFEVLKWETHVRPGFDKDPQAVVNLQLDVDYDVFLGIFWSRLGTSTGRAASGSVEEFQRAHARLKSTGTAPEIMLYFKDAPISPSKIDGEQFRALQTFKTSISELGGFFSSFEDQAGFEASLRTHLSAIAQKFASRDSTALAASPPSETQKKAPASSDDNDFGLLDYLDVYNVRTQDMAVAVTAINAATIRIGEQLSQRSSELSLANQNLHAAKPVITRSADDMFRYADTLSIQVVTLSTARQDAFAALSNAVALMPDFSEDPEQLATLRSTLSGTAESICGARNGLTAMRDAAASLPRISKELNKAKRAVTSNLDNFFAELDSTESTVFNIIEAIDRLG